MNELAATGRLVSLGLPGYVFAGLIAAHFVADSVLQTPRMQRGKSEFRWLLLHALQVTLVSALFVLPFLSFRTIIALVLIGASHTVIDHSKTLLSDREREPIALSVLDQGIHLAIIAAAAHWIASAPDQMAFLPVFSLYLPWLATTSLIVAVYAFNCLAASMIVAAVLDRFDLSASAGEGGARKSANPLAMGRVIGVLERLLALTLVLLDQWPALGLVVAAKSIARFKELENRRFSEYYLIGTLTSLLVAIGSGLLLRYLL